MGDSTSDAATAVTGGGSRDVETGVETPMRRSGRLRTAILILAVVILVAVVADFVGYVTEVTRLEIPASPRADGIVVLTGGRARIDAALRLLGEGRARRVLISGVNPAVDVDALAGVLDTDPTGPLSCCIDLGHAARDTVGNATEARAWTRRNDYASLIVVTSDYHMPRALAELGAAMPDVALTTFPVRDPDLRVADWWRDAATFGLLVREYVKFRLTSARVAVFDYPTSNDR